MTEIILNKCICAAICCREQVLFTYRGTGASCSVLFSSRKVLVFIRLRNDLHLSSGTLNSSIPYHTSSSRLESLISFGAQLCRQRDNAVTTVTTPDGCHQIDGQQGSSGGHQLSTDTEAELRQYKDEVKSLRHPVALYYKVK